MPLELGVSSLKARLFDIQKPRKPTLVAPPARQAPPPPIVSSPDEARALVQRGDVSARDKLAALKSQSLERRAPQLYAEIRRICGLPVVEPLSPEELEAFCRKEIKGPVYDEGFRFHECQANALLTDDLYGSFDPPVGLFCPIGCGRGKSLTALMLAQRNYERAERIVLIIPPNVEEEFCNFHLKFAREHVPFTMPVHTFLGNSSKKASLATSRWAGLYILPYSMFSNTRDATALAILDKIKPRMVIADEAHRLKNRKSARTKNVMTYLDECAPKFVCMSGTLTGKSIHDYYHLIRAALGPHCPLPSGIQQVEEWAGIVDTGCEPDTASAAPLQPLIDWAVEKDPEGGYTEDVGGFRRAYQKRLTTCPGVISSGDDDIGTSLILHNEPVSIDETTPEGKELVRLMKEVIEPGVTPSGDVIEYGIHAYHWLYELTAGFYTERFWPTTEVYGKRKGYSLNRAEENLAMAKVYHEQEAKYHKQVRSWLKDYSRPGLVSPMLLANHLARSGAPEHGGLLYDEWRKMKALDFEGRPVRDERWRRVCPYKIDRAVAWLKTLEPGEGGIVWFFHNQIGQWLREACHNAGIDALYAPSGKTGNRTISDKENFDRIIIASISAHCEGKELQHHTRQFFMQWPRSAIFAEQTLSRLHREGQQAEELIVERCDSTPFDKKNFAACLSDSVYIHQTMGTRQKLVYAAYDPMPETYPDDWLAERGFFTEKLDREAKKLMADRFGAKAPTVEEF